MKEVTELDVYRLAEELSDLIWTAYDEWLPKAQNTLGYQIIRSADSIAANLAEGYGRYTPADRRKFYLHQIDAPTRTIRRRLVSIFKFPVSSFKFHASHIRQSRDPTRRFNRKPVRLDRCFVNALDGPSTTIC
jgi:hypothetical protein